jgi:hypothetical protein
MLFHKISLNELYYLLYAFSLSYFSRVPYLVTIVVQADNLAARKGGELFGRTSDTTADIKYTHSRAKTRYVSEVVLVPCSCLLFVFRTSRISIHIERLTLRLKVEICCGVVVAIVPRLVAHFEVHQALTC